MRSKKSSVGLLGIFAAISTLALTGAQCAAQTETILHSFGASATDGQRPFTGLTVDASGNLYGMTFDGGAFGYGLVFKFSPTVSGGWTKQVLHNFIDNGEDGMNPVGFGTLVVEPSGKVYGTTLNGGAYGFGAVFELGPKVGGAWGEKIIYSFGALPDGEYPYASLIRDAAGNLYGTTESGGTNGLGTVFELKHEAGGAWIEQVLHGFANDGVDGGGPTAGLILDVAGNLYGTTSGGGTDGQGTVFELKRETGGGWEEEILHNFSGNGDGLNPGRALVFDATGNLYGTTIEGGAYSLGIAFELTPGPGGNWTETILHNFGNGTDGMRPNSSLIFDVSGNFYGTTGNGGTYFGGTAFKLTPSGGSNWTESILHSFGNGLDGNGPVSVALDSSGNLDGTTEYGGAHNLGTVFEITP